MSLTSCPKCGHTFDPVRVPVQRKAHMVWSNRMQRYVRKELTAAEHAEYEQRGSID